jgi:hypothetical protein
MDDQHMKKLFNLIRSIIEQLQCTLEKKEENKLVVKKDGLEIGLTLSFPIKEGFFTHGDVAAKAESDKRYILPFSEVRFHYNNGEEKEIPMIIASPSNSGQMASLLEFICKAVYYFTSEEHLREQLLRSMRGTWV